MARIVRATPPEARGAAPAAEAAEREAREALVPRAPVLREVPATRRRRTAPPPRTAKAVVEVVHSRLREEEQMEVPPRLDLLLPPSPNDRRQNATRRDCGNLGCGYSSSSWSPGASAQRWRQPTANASLSHARRRCCLKWRKRRRRRRRSRRKRRKRRRLDARRKRLRSRMRMSVPRKRLLSVRRQRKNVRRRRRRGGDEIARSARRRSQGVQPSFERRHVPQLSGNARRLRNVADVRRRRRSSRRLLR
mmetsp:Transcript_7792/g.20444  ORF Transcript_7792/g.20444 Transcript_7792/m.20444 type:complete len:249 (+) Transcript_7792:1635-2381(+)